MTETRERRCAFQWRGSVCGAVERDHRGYQFDHAFQPDKPESHPSDQARCAWSDEDGNVCGEERNINRHHHERLLICHDFVEDSPCADPFVAGGPCGIPRSQHARIVKSHPFRAAEMEGGLRNDALIDLIHSLMVSARESGIVTSKADLAEALRFVRPLATRPAPKGADVTRATKMRNALACVLEWMDCEKCLHDQGHIHHGEGTKRDPIVTHVVHVRRTVEEALAMRWTRRRVQSPGLPRGPQGPRRRRGEGVTDLAEAIVSRMVANDAIMPVQWFGQLKLRSPIERLMSAVLDDAFRVIRADTKEGQAAREWFRSRDKTWPFAFLVVCEALDLDPSTYRRIARLVRRKRLRVSRIVRRSAGKSDSRRIGA